jgi:hypothetical protein
MNSRGGEGKGYNIGLARQISKIFSKNAIKLKIGDPMAIMSGEP